MIWNESKECMSREQMHDLQSKRLRKLVSTVYHNTPFYRRKMQEMDITPDDIRSIDDIVKLPFTTKQDCETTILDYKPCYIRDRADTCLIGDNR